MIAPASGRLLRVALAFCIALMGVSEAADTAWKDSLTTRPGKHPPLRPLTATYDFGWSGLKAADATARFVRSRGIYKLSLSARTSGLARTLWRMDSQGVSTVNASSLKPIKLDQTEKYARKAIRTTVDFTSKGPRRLKVVTPPDPEPPKAKTFKIANTHDLHSALLFIRSQPLRNRDTIRMAVFPGSSPYLAEVTVTGREKISAAGKEWNAITCKIHLREIDKDMELAPHKKFKRATAWLSDDEDRLLLRIEAEVYVGSIWAEMQSVNFADSKAGRRN